MGLPPLEQVEEVTPPQEQRGGTSKKRKRSLSPRSYTAEIDKLLEEAKIKEAETEKALADAKKKVQVIRLAHTLAISTRKMLEKKRGI